MLDWNIAQTFIALLVCTFAMTYVVVRAVATLLVRWRLPDATVQGRTAFARAIATSSACETALLLLGMAIVLSVSHISEHVLRLPTWCTVLAFICAMALCGFVGARIEQRLRLWTGVKREASLLLDLRGTYAAFHRGGAAHGATQAGASGQ